MSPKRRRITGMVIVAALLASLLGMGFGRVDARAQAPRAYGTFTPTPTRTRTVTASPTPAKVDFTMTNSNSVSPEDALAEMTFFQGGGCYDCGVCNPNLQYLQPARALMVPVTLNVCWPQLEEHVTFTAYRPDGRFESRQLEVHGGGVIMTYQPLYDYPTGVYRLRLDSSRTGKEFSVTYYNTGTARIMAVPDSPFLPNYGFMTAHGRLVLDRFIPGERVRLFGYQYILSNAELKLLAWQEMIIRGDGRMPVSVDLPGLPVNVSALFVAYGERSGEVHYQQVIGNNYLADPIRDRVLFCPGAKQSRLTPNFMSKANLVARVAHTDGTRLRIHRGPGFSSPTIALVPELTLVTLKSGPACVDRSWFWEIEWEGVRGWVAEADQQDYLVEPEFPVLLPMPVITLRPRLPVQPSLP